MCSPPFRSQSAATERSNLSQYERQWLSRATIETIQVTDNTEEKNPLLSAARRIPPELFEHILKHLLPFGDQCHAHSSYDIAMGRVRSMLARRDILRCSLTCRYWASHIRPDIFRVLRLGTYADASTLVTLLQSTGPSPNIGLWTTSLCLTQRPTERSWIHLLLPHIGPKGLFASPLTICLHEEGDTTATPLTRLLCYHDLPRTIPSVRQVSKRKLNLIELKNQTFRTFRHLFAIMNIEGCQRLLCKDIIWNDAEPLSVFDTPASVSRGRPRRTVDGDIVVSNCREAWPFIWCLAITSTPVSSHPNPPLDTGSNLVYVHQSQLPRILELVRWFTEQQHFVHCDYHGVRRPIYTFKLRRTEAAQYIMVYNSSAPILSEIFETLRFTIEPATGFVTEIGIGARFHSELEEDNPLNVIAREWHMLTEIFDSFGPMLSTVIVRAWDLAPPKLQALADSLVRQMPEISNIVGLVLGCSRTAPRNGADMSARRQARWTVDEDDGPDQLYFSMTAGTSLSLSDDNDSVETQAILTAVKDLSAYRQSRL